MRRMRIGRSGQPEGGRHSESACYFGAICLFWACVFSAAGSRAAEPQVPSKTNLLENGGFEIWHKLDPREARQVNTTGLRLEPAGSAPEGWTPHREPYKGQQPTAVLAIDESMKHSGERSVRIENRDMRDITYVRYSTERFLARADDPRNIRPNRRYAIRWWVRGQQIDPAGTGPILMMQIHSTKDGKSYGTPASEEGPRPNGTFDWQPRQFVFITDAHARSISLTMQLRWTTGTVWYDDVELIDLGPVVNVETY